MENILFVCSANKDRSRTAEDHFSSIYKTLHFDSAGTNKKICHQIGTTYIDEEQLITAAKVFVMEPKHKKAIESLFGSSYSKKITVLYIEDVYEYGDKALKKVLENKMEGYL